MKRILDSRSRRHGFDGWCVFVQHQGSPKWWPLEWTFSTTRGECREVYETMTRSMLGDKYKIDKARLKVEAIH